MQYSTYLPLSTERSLHTLDLVRSFNLHFCGHCGVQIIVHKKTKPCDFNLIYHWTFLFMILFQIIIPKNYMYGTGKPTCFVVKTPTKLPCFCGKNTNKLVKNKSCFLISRDIIRPTINTKLSFQQLKKKCPCQCSLKYLINRNSSSPQK